MFFNRYFPASFALIICIALLHYLALEQAYYWTVWWYDIMMHFLGGLWVALFALWVCATRKISFLPQHIPFLKVLLFVLLVGVLWEVYELVFKLTFVSDPEYWSDSTIDLVMDTLGGVVGGFFLNRKNNV